MTLLSKKYMFILGIGLLGLILFSPFIGISSATSMNLNETQILKTDSQLLKEQHKNENIPSASSAEALQSFMYGNLDIINTFSFVCFSEFIIVGTQGETTPDVFVVSSSDNTGQRFSTTSNDMVKDVQEYDKDFSDNLLVIGNREQNSQDSVFYFTLSPLDLTRSIVHEITIEEDCYFKQMELMPNGHFLVLIQSYNASKASLHLYEIDPISGDIVNNHEFSNSETNIMAEIDLGALNCIYIFNSGQILLIGQNSTLSDAGVIIYKGNFGSSWNTYSISGDVEYWGLVVDQNDYFHLALQREDPQTGENALDIVKFSESLILQANYSLISPSQSYNVLNFQINSVSSSNLPFLVYDIWSSADNPGIGFCYINENGILQQHEKDPSDTYSYNSGDLAFLSNGDVSIAISKIDNEYAEITIYRIGSSNYHEYSITNQVFSPWIEANMIGESSHDNSIYIGIRDFGKSGVVTLDQNLNLEKELYLDSDLMCKAKYYEDAGVGYFFMYGTQGDYFNYHGNAIILLFSVEGIKIASNIREENNYASEIWDQIIVQDGFIYLTGYNTQDSSILSTIMGGFIRFSDLNSPYRICSNINIYSGDTANEYINEGILKGTGQQNDPYVLDSIIIDGNKEDTQSNQHGISIGYYAFYIIQNCIISNIQDGDNLIAGIQLMNIDHFQIQNNSISYCNNGIEIQNGDNGTISNNTIENCKYSGIILDQYQNSDNGDNGNLISYNIIQHITTCGDNWQGSGIYLNKGSYNTIEHNTITDNCYCGVYLDNCWEECSNTFVWNTLVQDNDLSGNQHPYNSDLGKDYGNIFKNNIGADDFPSTNGGNPFDNIAGFSTGLIISIGMLSFIAIITNIIHRRKYKLK